MVSAAQIDEVIALCRRLRLRYIREQAPDVLATAKAQRWDPTELLRVLLEAEAAGRDRSTTENRRRKARFPAGKTFDAWDSTRSTIPTGTQGGLRTLEWVDRHENLVICGPSGTGKSHLCEALGHAAIDNGHTVAWFSIEDLGALVRRHRVDDTITKAFRPIIRSELIIIDVAYERRSVAVSSNLHPSGFDQLMDRTIATALIDRLMHHAHIVLTEGESIRLADATSGKGVTPLT